METYNRHPWSTSWSRDDAEERLAAFEIPPGASVVDAGCADGWHAIELAKRGHPVTAFEQQPEVYKTAFECAVQAGRPDNLDLRCEKYLGTVASDALLCLSVLHQMPVDEGLAWLRRILPPVTRTVCLEVWLDELPPFAQDVPRLRRWLRAKPELLAVLKEAGFTKPTVEVVLPGLRTTLLQSWRWGKKPR